MRFDAARIVVGKYLPWTESEISVVNWGVVARAVWSASSQHPLSLGIRMFLSSSYRGGNSHLRVLCPSSGEKGGD